MSSNLAFVIEDDFDGSMVFAKALEANGLEPEQIMTGNLAIEKLEKSVPTLVILDLHLPIVSGPDILRKIRADDRLSDTLVVVVTADPRMADIIREDADLVLLKPTTFSQVRDLVGRLMALRERNAKAAAPAPVPAASVSPALTAPETVLSTSVEPETVLPASVKPEPVPTASTAPASVEPEPVPTASTAPASAEPESVPAVSSKPASAEPAPKPPASAKRAAARANHK